MTDHQMPKRPRQHQVESESRAAIRAAIPSLWVYRDLEQDYGIDGEVEIFDQASSATGAKFLVQLKGTDEPDIRKAQRLWFPEAKHNYYSSLDLPVLIVRYHAPTKRLFVRWYHSLKPVSKKRERVGFTLHLTDDDRWDHTTANRLEAEVEAYRAIRSPRLDGPLEFVLFIEEGCIGIPSYQLRLDLQQAMRRVQHLIVLQPDEPANRATSHKIAINSKGVEITVGGMPSFILHTEANYLAENSQTSLESEILLCLGLALDKQGHAIEAAEIISLFWRDSEIAREVILAMPIATCLARANQVHTALEVAELFFQNETTINSAQLFLVPILLRPEGLRATLRDFCVGVLLRIARDLERRGMTGQAAAQYYNCANALHSMKRYREAVRYYREAARVDESYLNRDYFWREFAGVLFSNRRYTLSAEYYKRALDIEELRLTKALYADALMFSGKYRLAAEIFDGFFDTGNDPDDAEWCLKRYALSQIREVTGLDEQKRKKPRFPDSFDPEKMEDVDAINIYRRIIQEEDALCALAWYNLGSIDYRAGDNESATVCYLLAALIVPGDLDAWCNAISLAIKTENPNLFGHALMASYQINGEALLRRLVDRVPEKQDEFLRIVNEVTPRFQSASQPPPLKGPDITAEPIAFSIDPNGNIHAETRS